MKTPTIWKYLSYENIIYYTYALSKHIIFSVHVSHAHVITWQQLPVTASSHKLDLVLEDFKNTTDAWKLYKQYLIAIFTV